MKKDKTNYKVSFLVDYLVSADDMMAAHHIACKKHIRRFGLYNDHDHLVSAHSIREVNDDEEI